MIERTLFESEHEAFRDSVGRFIRKELAPRHADWEAEGIVPRAVWAQAGAAGLLCCGVGAAYGGPGADFRFNVVVIEELARAGISAPGFFIHSDMVAPYLELYAGEPLKRRWLPRMVAGDAIGAIGITEPGAGSDVRGISTVARREGDAYVVRGQKTFISNGHNCDFVIVVATSPSPATRGALSLILVETDRAGFSRGPRLSKLGNRGQDTAELFFDDVRIPVENLIGIEHKAMGYLMNNLARERLAQAVRAAAVVETTLQRTVDYVKERKAFGQTLANFQNTQFKLAELRSAFSAARVYVDRCIELQLEEKLDAVEAASLKLQLVELQCTAVDECLQLHGGSGYMWDNPVCRAYADARIAKIAGGSVEIMKQIIARDLFAGSSART